MWGVGGGEGERTWCHCGRKVHEVFANFEGERFAWGLEPPPPPHPLWNTCVAIWQLYADRLNFTCFMYWWRLVFHFRWWWHDCSWCWHYWRLQPVCVGWGASVWWSHTSWCSMWTGPTSCDLPRPIIIKRGVWIRTGFGIPKEFHAQRIESKQIATCFWWIRPLSATLNFQAIYHHSKTPKALIGLYSWFMSGHPSLSTKEIQRLKAFHLKLWSSKLSLWFLTVFYFHAPGQGPCWCNWEGCKALVSVAKNGNSWIQPSINPVGV